jgi:hypothetical protein
MGVLSLFLFNFIVFPKERDYLKDLPEGGDILGTPRSGRLDPFYTEGFYDVIVNFPNPMEVKKRTPTRRDARPLLSKYIDVVGTMPNSDPKKQAAFLKLKKTGSVVLAYYQEDIRNNKGEIVRELKGVRIIEVHFDKVVFNNNGKREELYTSSSKIRITPSKAEKITSPGDFKKFRSHLMLATSSRLVWAIDPREAEYLAENKDAILDKDVTLSFLPEGGVRIDSIRENSIVRARGFRPGDIIRTINGRKITAENLKKLAEDPVIKNARSITVALDRWGKQMIIEYRLRR